MIVVFGSINLDLIFQPPTLPGPGETVICETALMQPGGKGANQAVAAARDGAHVIFAGAVGQDAFAAAAMAGMHGIDTTRVARLPGVATGCAAIVVDPQGQNIIAVGAGANLRAKAGQIEEALLGPATTLVLQMETSPAEIAVLIRRAGTRGVRIVLNLAPYVVLPDDALRMVDVLVVNESEAAALATGHAVTAAADALRAALGPDVVCTRGEAGVDLATADGAPRIPAFPVRAVDTTAAGDCFVGVLAAALDRGAELNAACHRASAAAALTCTRRGSQASLPMDIEIDALLAASPSRHG